MYGLSLLFFVFDTCEEILIRYDEIMILNMVQYEKREIKKKICFCLSVSLISFFFLYARVLVALFVIVH